MSRLALTVARFCLAAWVGAAALFVINGVQQVTFSGFDSIVRGQLALLRFPAYYAMGFGLVGIGTLGMAIARFCPGLPRGRWLVALALATTSLALLGVDYVYVYGPLAAMLSPPGAARPANFETYHRASETINTVHVGLAMLAALLAGWPVRTSAGTRENGPGSAS